MEFLKNLFSSGDFMSHGYCYLWNRGLVWLHAVSDVLIALAYFSIPVTLVYFVRKRPHWPFHWMFLCFGLFIVACGTTHAMEVWTLWHATYWLSGIVKAITALASVPTAILLVQLMPKAIALPTPEELEKVNHDLLNRTDELARRNAELAAANAALRHSEERSRLLFDSNPLALWVYDVKTLAFLDANHSAICNYGYSREELLSMTIMDIRPPMEVPALLESVAAAPAGTQVSGAWRHRKKDGTVIEVEITSHPLSFNGRDARLVVASDVTARKRAEKMFKDLLESAPDAMVIVNADGRIILVNSQTQKLFGYLRDEMLGQKVEMLIPERHHTVHPRHRTGFFTEPHARAMGANLELHARRKDGTEFPVEISLGPLATEEGLLVSSAIRDISERKRNEEKLQRQRIELEAANKELEAFSYSVSHDLRAPLRSIDGFSQALAEDYAGRLDARGQNYVARVRAATQRMGLLIDDLLDLSRVTRAEIHREKVNLTVLAQSILAELRNTEPQREVECIVGDDIEVVGDHQLLRIALDNLLGNAWKYTSKKRQARIEFGKTDSPDGAAFFVRDDGVGYDPAYSERLFGAFQRLHGAAEFPGNGIGLATVQRIIHRHGGRVWAEGAPERGATFYFTL